MKLTLEEENKLRTFYIIARIGSNFRMYSEAYGKFEQDGQGIQDGLFLPQVEM